MISGISHNLSKQVPGRAGGYSRPGGPAREGKALKS